MYQKVLFPTDFSLYSQRITGHIREIPGISEVVLLHVVDTAGSLKTGPGAGTEIDRVKGLLAENKKILEDQGLTVRVELDEIEHTIPEGTIGSRIQKTAEQEKVSLVVMGARGKSLHDLMLGSVSTYVLHHTTIPLLLIKSPKDDGTSHPPQMQSPLPLFSRVLLPTDFSAPAEEVIRFVKAVSGIREIILLHVINEEKNNPRLPEYVDLATRKIGVIRDELVRSGFFVKSYVRVGYPPDEINLVAGQENATFIALSPLGEGWVRELKEFFVGSTTFAVVRRATRPVLVVRPPRTHT
jgi:nucleotide-binding universal stress UspA family protein